MQSQFQGIINFFKNLSKVEDKRPLYLWVGVLLVNIGAYLVCVVMEVVDGGYHVFESLVKVVPSYLPVFGISIFVSTVPTWLSGSTLKYRNWIGFVIPILLLAPVPYLVWYMNTCTGKMCGIGAYVLTLILGISAVVFTSFYLIGIFLRKWSQKVAFCLVYFESFLIGVLISTLVYAAFLDSTLASLEAGKKMELSRGVHLCESIPGLASSRKSSCWFEIAKTNPYVDVCSLTRNEDSKWSCTIDREDVYRTIDRCENKDSHISYEKKDDSAENARLIECWGNMAKKYPGLDICRASTYEWNKEKCALVFKTLTQ